MTATGFETQYTKVSGLWISVSALTTMSSFIPHSSPLPSPFSPSSSFQSSLPYILSSPLSLPVFFSSLLSSFFHFLSSSVFLNLLVPTPFLLISLFLSIIFSSFCLFLCQPSYLIVSWRPISTILPCPPPPLPPSHHLPTYQRQ